MPDAVFHRKSLAEVQNLHIIGLTHDEAIAFPALDLEIWGRAHRDYSDMIPFEAVRPRRTRWQIATAHGHYVPTPDRVTRPRPSWLIGDADIAATGADYVALGHWNSPAKVGEWRGRGLLFGIAGICRHFQCGPDGRCRRRFGDARQARHRPRSVCAGLTVKPQPTSRAKRSLINLKLCPGRFPTGLSADRAMSANENSPSSAIERARRAYEEMTAASIQRRNEAACARSLAQHHGGDRRCLHDRGRPRFELPERLADEFDPHDGTSNAGRLDHRFDESRDGADPQFRQGQHLPANAVQQRPRNLTCGGALVPCEAESKREPLALPNQPYTPPPLNRGPRIDAVRNSFSR